MKENNVNEMKDLIEVKQSIFKKLKRFLEDVFSGEKFIQKDIKILTFEEQLLSPEEREIFRARLEKDNEDAKYYKQAFENPEEFFVNLDEIEEDVSEDDSNTDSASDSKEDFFSKYEGIKNGTENIDNLDITDLLKVEYLLREEISMRKTNMDPEEVAMIEKELKALEEENRLLTEELKKLEENN